MSVLLGFLIGMYVTGAIATTIGMFALTVDDPFEWTRTSRLAFIVVSGIGWPLLIVGFAGMIAKEVFA